MKAAVLSAVGGPITIEDIPTPSPQAGEVLVRVAACGVCHTDLHVVKGAVQFPLPCVLGHEISGVVETVTPDVKTAQPGDTCAMMTAYGAVKHQARVQPNETVAVIGTGGVGSNVIQVAKTLCVRTCRMSWPWRRAGR